MNIRDLLLLLLLLIPALAPMRASAEGIDPGDEITILLPGEASFDEPFTVDRDGNITLPEIGKLQVAGLSETRLVVRLRQSMVVIYRELNDLQAYVSRHRMLVTVSGYVERPGEVQLPDNADIQMALHAAGGLRSGAQLDRMQLRRGGEVTSFDYKRYLDSGDRRVLPSMQSLDTLFVPASPMTGNVEVEFDPSKIADGGDAAEDRKAIKVFGEVNSPGSFSFRASQSLIDLLMRAGGVTRYAGVEQIRVISGGEPRLFNMKQFLDTGDSGLLPKIEPGTTVFVPKQEEEIKSGANVVYVMGEVFKPGAYEGKPGASFMDILANAGGPTRFAESRQIRILKADGEVQPFDLAAFTEGSGSGPLPAIEPGDAVFVPEKTDMNEKSWLKVQPSRAIRIIGEVLRPGRYEWSDEMSLMDLLAHAGGPNAQADTANIEIVTPNADGSTRTWVFDLDDFIKRGGREDELPELRAASIVRVHHLPQDPSDNKAQWVRQSADKSIYVFGQVGAPGRYMITPEMNLLDILSAADGPTENADIHNIRVNHRNYPAAKVSRLDLGIYFETGDESLLPRIRAGDSIYVPEKNRLWLNHSKETTIRVLGAINKPGRYKFNDSMTLLDLLAEAGGTTSDAYIQKISIINKSCCADQARTFDLLAFSQSGDFTRLPVIRSGDTVFVPERTESTESKFRNGLGDAFRMISMAALLGLL